MPDDPLRLRQRRGALYAIQYIKHQIARLTENENRRDAMLGGIVAAVTLGVVALASNFMSAETATNIQAVAAIVFLVSVVSDARARRSERRRRARLAVAAALRHLWVQSTVMTVSKTDEELSGLDSPRIIDFINQQLEARGYTWRYPLEREE